MTDPTVDHRGYVVEVMKDEKGVRTGVYLVSFQVSRALQAVIHHGLKSL